LDYHLIHSFEVASKTKGHCYLLLNIANSTLGKNIGKPFEIRINNTLKKFKPAKSGEITMDNQLIYKFEIK
jgi:hypothetical protein